MSRHFGQWVVVAGLGYHSLSCRARDNAQSVSNEDTLPTLTTDADHRRDVSSSDIGPSQSEVASSSALPPMRRGDWREAIGRWTFDRGEAVCECKATSSLIYYAGSTSRDFDAEVEFVFLGPESSLGILFREVGEDFYREASFYQFEWYSHGSHHNRRLSLMKKNPYWRQIVEPKYPEAPYNRPIRMRVVAEDARYRAYLDGELVFDRRDDTFVREGRLGLHVFQPRPLRITGFRVTNL
jgi:hypothetical protein